MNPCLPSFRLMNRLTGRLFKDYWLIFTQLCGKYSWFMGGCEKKNLLVSKLLTKRDSPEQIPVPMMGGFDMHFKGVSQVPENPPTPPHVSPTVFAQTLQHLGNLMTKIKVKNFNFMLQSLPFFHFYFTFSFPHSHS